MRFISTCCVSIMVLFVVACGESETHNNVARDQSKKVEKVSDNSNVTADPSELDGKKVYVNPVDGKSYTSEGEWVTASPDEYRPDTSNVMLDRVILVTDQNAVPVVFGTVQLAEFIHASEAVVQAELKHTEGVGELLVQFTIFHDQELEVDVKSMDEVDAEGVAKILEGLSSLKDTRTMRDSLTFQTHYLINK